MINFWFLHFTLDSNHAFYPSFVRKSNFKDYLLDRKTLKDFYQTKISVLFSFNQKPEALSQKPVSALEYVHFYLD